VPSSPSQTRVTAIHRTVARQSGGHWAGLFEFYKIFALTDNAPGKVDPFEETVAAE